jgi:hypothetical protein
MDMKVISAFRDYINVSEVINEIWQVTEDCEVSQIFNNNPRGIRLK